jgi:hypothetical protein
MMVGTGLRFASAVPSVRPGSLAVADGRAPVEGSASDEAGASADQTCRVLTISEAEVN